MGGSGIQNSFCLLHLSDNPAWLYITLQTDLCICFQQSKLGVQCFLSAVPVKEDQHLVCVVML